MPVYNDTVMDHFMNPRNVGEIENPDGVGEEGNPVCGDMMTFYIKVKDGKLEDVKYKTFGCGAAIAVSSIVSELAKGKSLAEVKKMKPMQVVEELGGLPKNKHHCSNLGAQALIKAIEDYESKSGKAPAKAAAKPKAKAAAKPKAKTAAKPRAAAKPKTTAKTSTTTRARGGK